METNYHKQSGPMSARKEKMSDKINKEIAETPAENNLPEIKTRREFLRSLGKWSAAIIGAVGAANLIDPPAAAGWVNGGAAWANARGGTAGWVNRVGGWVNGGGWVNRGGGTWVNGGGGWVNARGGWINRY